ncbi:MAG TPA: ParB/RepB/Spo0J family partition protein [Vicinamibacteria bacterium]|nr:ParB/RepB/Spo0J family partition protein [Vicinamibacteria bacterium]
MKRKVLGKGLAALLPDSPSGSEGEKLLELPPDRIDPNPEQPRQHIDPEKLSELAKSMIEQGVVQPLVVRRVGSRFQIIAGERRWRAAREAGLEKVPVIVRQAADGELLEIALVENIQREELNPMEEAGAYRRLIAELGYSQEQVALRVGKDRSTVANLLRLLRLPREIRGLVAEQKLSPGHARPLLTLDAPDTQVAIAREIVEKGLSVRDVERRVQAANRPAKGAKVSRGDANTRDAESHLEQALGTRVRVRRQGRKGSRGLLTIEFHSEDELHRIYETVLRGARTSKPRAPEL